MINEKNVIILNDDDMNESYDNDNDSIIIESCDPETGMDYDDSDENDDDFGAEDYYDEEDVLEESSTEYILHLLSEMSDEEFTEFCNSSECEILVEAGKFTKNSILSLNKNDELKKRTNIIAINIEKSKNSSLYKEYIKYRKKYIDAKNKILTKNFSKASKMATKQLRTYAKNIDPKRIPVVARRLDNKKKA